MTGGSIAHSVVMKSRRVPDPAVYTAYDPDTMELVKLNRKDRLEVRPTLSHNWVTANAGDEKGEHNYIENTFVFLQCTLHSSYYFPCRSAFKSNI